MKMKYLIWILGATTAVVTVALVSAQTTPPTTGPVNDQRSVDAAMERSRTKQAAGRSLEERVTDLERRIGTMESARDKRIADLETRLAAAAKQIDQLVRAQAPTAPSATANRQPTREKAEVGSVRMWQCWVSSKSDVAGSGHPYRDYVEAGSYSEASEMFHKKHPNENVAQTEEKRP
jgi:uncharacterized coiled-coil protein SlyX